MYKDPKFIYINGGTILVLTISQAGVKKGPFSNKSNVRCYKNQIIAKVYGKVGKVSVAWMKCLAYIHFVERYRNDDDNKKKVTEKKLPE